VARDRCQIDTSEISLLTLLLTVLVSAPVQFGGHWPTLAEALRGAGVPLPSDTNGAVRITSFGTLADDRVYLIAYYDATPDNLLGELHIRAFDKRRRVWRSVTMESIGSILSINRSGGLFYVKGHSSPSATPLLVLDTRLALKRTLDGWPKLFLADGRVLFVRSMRHFVPTHAEVLALYDPVSNRDVTIYPAWRVNDRGAEKVPGSGDLWVDRSIGDVTPGRRPQTVEFRVTVQPMRIERDNRGHAAAPTQTIDMSCDVSGRVPSCRPFTSEVRPLLSPAPGRR
jgi:hypothetical protein